MSYVTLRIIIILMETIKNLHISAHLESERHPVSEFWSHIEMLKAGRATYRQSVRAAT